MEETYLDRDGILVTDSKIVFRERVNSNTFEELTIFVAHVASVRLHIKTIRPSPLPTLMMVLGALLVLGGIAVFVGAYQSGADPFNAIAALLFGGLFLGVGLWLRRTNKEREEYTVALRTSAGDTKVLIDLESEGEFAELVVGAVEKAVIGRDIS